MNITRTILLLGVLCCLLTGCVHPVTIKVNESTERISNMAHVAKEDLEECLQNKQKKDADLSACESVEAKLDEINNAADELAQFVRRHL